MITPVNQTISPNARHTNKRIVAANKTKIKYKLKISKFYNFKPQHIRASSGRQKDPICKQKFRIINNILIFLHISIYISK